MPNFTVMDPDYNNPLIRMCGDCQKGNLRWIRTANKDKVLMDIDNQVVHFCLVIGPDPEDDAEEETRILMPRTKRKPVRRTHTHEDITQRIDELNEEMIETAKAMGKDVGDLSHELDQVKAKVSRIPVEHTITIEKAGKIREIDGRPHFKLDTLVHVLNERLHVFCVGPTGGGKTTGAGMAAKALGVEYYESSMGPSTSGWDLTGFMSPRGKYIRGILREPYEFGGVLMLDEMDNGNASVLTALNSAMANDSYFFPDTKVDRHPDFFLVAAGNTYGRGADRVYVGRNQLDAATLDRFVSLDWEYDEEAEFDWAGGIREDWVKFIQSVRKIVFDHKMRIVVSPRASIFGVRLLESGMERAEVEEMVLWKGISSEDRLKILGGIPSSPQALLE